MKLSVLSSVLLAGAASAAPASMSSSPNILSARAMSQFAGVNIAGFDFGCGIDGTCDTTKVVPPLPGTGGDGPAQMNHFANDDGLNIFRLPVGWQYLVNNNLGGPLDSANLATYDKLVQACLQTGAYCVIDIHNYARWNGKIIGQGGPTNEQFVSVWTQLATKYKSEAKIVFGVMNEPHDVPDIKIWAATAQAAVTAIRNAGATTQMILLPGNDFTSAQKFVTNGSGPALLVVTNPDGTTTNLIFDVHKYLDSDNSGTHVECVGDSVDSAFAPLATWLRDNKRQAILSETGGGNTASCERDVCAELAYLAANTDVYLGYIGWSAGSFDSSYELSETPNGNQDTSLVKACIARK